MGKQKTPQVVGGSKEALLVGAGSDTVQEKTGLSYKEERRLYYTELLREYFSKFFRWNAIAEAEGQEIGSGKRKFEVFTTPNGSQIAKPGEVHNSEDKILEMQIDIREGSIENTHFMNITVKPGRAGEQLLVDSSGQPILEAAILIESWGLIDHNIVKISSMTPPDKSGRNGNANTFGAISFEPSGDIIRVGTGGHYHTSSRKYAYGMLEKEATHMLTTIDRLIPTATTVTAHPGRRITHELAPTPGRRPPGR